MVAAKQAADAGVVIRKFDLSSIANFSAVEITEVKFGDEIIADFAVASKTLIVSTDKINANGTLAITTTGAPEFVAPKISATTAVTAEMSLVANFEALTPAIIVTNDTTGVERQFTFDAFVEGAKVLRKLHRGEFVCGYHLGTQNIQTRKEPAAARRLLVGDADRLDTMREVGVAHCKVVAIDCEAVDGGCREGILYSSLGCRGAITVTNVVEHRRVDSSSIVVACHNARCDTQRKHTD